MSQAPTLHRLLMTASVLVAISVPLGAATAEAPPPETSPVPPDAAPSGVAEAPELLLFQEVPSVLGAAKYEQTARDAPASVTVITAEDIALYGYTNLAEILRTQRSFYLFSDGMWTFAGVRGFMRPGEWNARILVLVNGRPTREPIYGMTHLDREMVVPVENIKRLEIIRGPGSALYGSNAVFAVVNIITRDGADVDGMELKGQFGNRDTARGVATFGKRFDNGLDVLFSAARFTSRGDDDIHYPGVDDPALDYGHMRDSDYEGAGSLFLKAAWGDLTLELNYQKRNTDNASALYQTWWYNSGQSEEERFGVALRLDHQIDRDRSLHATVSFNRYDYEEYNTYDGGVGVGIYRYTSLADADWMTADVHYDWQVTPEHRLVVGTEANWPLTTRQHDWDTAWGNELDTDRTTKWWALYAQDEYTPVDWLTLTAGIRVDYWDRFPAFVSPRGAVILRPSKRDTVKLLYGRAFRAPNLYEMFYAIPAYQVGNPDLDPESNDTYEVAWERDHGDGWQTVLSYYFWQIRDAIADGTDPQTGLIQTRNVGTHRAHGIEGEVTKRFKSGARLRVSGLLGHAVDNDGNRLSHSPDALLTLAGAVPVINERTFLAVETQIVGSMGSDFGGRADPTYVTNLVLTSKEVRKGLDLHVGVYNLFGELAEVPRTSAVLHGQRWLRHPGTLVLAGFTFRF